MASAGRALFAEMGRPLMLDTNPEFASKALTIIWPELSLVEET